MLARLLPAFALALFPSGASIPEREIQSWEEARAIEKAPADLNARSLLLAWYVWHYQEPAANPGRLRQILWVIGNQPDMRLSNSLSLNVDETDREAFRAVSDAWRKQVLAQPDNAVVLIRAAHAFAHSEPETATAWLKSAIARAVPLAKKEEEWPSRVKPPDFWCTWSYLLSEAKTELARLYVDAMLGVTARTGLDGTGPVDPAVAASGFARATREEIERSQDAWFVEQAGSWLHITIGSLLSSGRGDTRLVPLAWACLQRAERLDNTSWAAAMNIEWFQREWSAKQPGIPPPVPRIEKSGADAPQPLEQVAAACPANLGYQFGPAGLSVNVKLIVATDGHVRYALLQGGHPAAIRPALEAARQWRFAPAYRGKEPVEVETAVAVPVCAQRP